jgi:hypothetical protein
LSNSVEGREQESEEDRETSHRLDFKAEFKLNHYRLEIMAAHERQQPAAVSGCA